MKLSIILWTSVLFLLCLPGNAQIKDTIFIERNIREIPYHIYNPIFIDTSFMSEFKMRLIDFSFGKYDSLAYFEYIRNKRPFPRVDIPENVPRKWIALKIYKGDFFTYYPSDGSYHFKIEISDSAVIDFTNEGPEPCRLQKIKYLSPKKILIEKDNNWLGKTITIDLINSVRGIAVFTFDKIVTDRNERQMLMVDATKASLIPVIVNYCKTDRTGEFEFGKVDFHALMK